MSVRPLEKCESCTKGQRRVTSCMLSKVTEERTLPSIADAASFLVSRPMVGVPFDVSIAISSGRRPESIAAVFVEGTPPERPLRRRALINRRNVTVAELVEMCVRTNCRT